MSSPLNQLFTDPIWFVAFAVAIIIAITVHEFCHALVATVQGDPTARNEGRLSLNPVRHLDPFGLLFIVLAGFGWGRPVPFMPSLLRNQRVGPLLVSLVGPISNLVMAVAGALVLKAMLATRTGNETAFTFVAVFMQINLILAVFNLLPIPPLDGSRILAAVLPPSRQGIVHFLDQYGIFLLLGLILLPALYPDLNWLGPLFERAQELLLRLVGLN